MGVKELVWNQCVVVTKIFEVRLYIFCLWHETFNLTYINYKKVVVTLHYLVENE